MEYLFMRKKLMQTESKIEKTNKKDTSGCCSTSETMKTEDKVEETYQKQIRDQYGNIAQTSTGDIDTPEELSKNSYSKEELNSIPKESNLGLGTGNPVSLANIQEGEIVLDLGSGGGIDVFLAAQKVGLKGKAIGVDMTPQMVDKARLNAKKNNITNVEFRLGEIEHLPVADQSVDVIISNCVVNLSPDKDQVFREINRVLKPNGRIVVSDIVLSKDMPDKVKDILESGTSCASRALTQDEYLGGLEKVGLVTEIKDIQYIKPQRKGELTDKGSVKRKLIANGKEHSVELTSEEDKRMDTAIMKAYILGKKQQ